MSQTTSFNNLLSVSAFTLSQSIKQDNIQWDDCEEGSRTISEHVSLSRITEKLVHMNMIYYSVLASFCQLW